MNICIITVYNSQNYGSYWQARALGEFLIGHGHDVTYLKRDAKGTSNSVKSMLKRSGRSITHLQIKELLDVIKNYQYFKKAQRWFNEIDGNVHDIDVCIIGSDTLWNLSSKYFRDNRRLYWGGGFVCAKNITYGVSISDTPYQIVEETDDIRLYLESIDAISVRDERTRQVISNSFSVDCKVVCDPTLLVTSEYFKHYSSKKNIMDDYILIYFSENQISQSLIKAIKSYSIDCKQKVISVGQYIPGVEWIQGVSVEEFLMYFENASLVVTNTFHGTMFSIVFKKNVVIQDCGKSKVNDAVTRFGLDARIYRDGADPSKTIAEPIDWEMVEERVVAMRAKSIEYLHEAIGV